MEQITLVQVKSIAVNVITGHIRMANYFHSAILPVIASPDQAEVISLAPDFITPQDGYEKQSLRSSGSQTLDRPS